MLRLLTLPAPQFIYYPSAQTHVKVSEVIAQEIQAQGCDCVCGRAARHRILQLKGKRKRMRGAKYGRIYNYWQPHAFAADTCAVNVYQTAILH
jgi:hypothetical protein